MRVARFRHLLAILAAGFFAACASTTPGAQPHDMSATQHETMASQEQRAAGPVGGTVDGGYWTSVTNPTAEHLEDAKKHQKMAADHRAASQALRDAEARACFGLPEHDRDTSPFEHREDIASVEPLTVGTPSGKSTTPRTEGAVITFRAVPGMTAQWLQRVVDCHLARNAALGHDVPEMPNCPLVPKDVAAKVTATDSGFAVAVRSDDSRTADEILRRARRAAIR